MQEAEAIEQIRRALVERVGEDHHRSGFARRDAHPKAHGCAEAVVRVRDDLPAELREGVFEPGAVYRAWVRLSNAGAREASDRGRDARGMAIKLMGVDGLGAVDGRPRATQDFVMIDSPRFFVPDAARYVDFVRSPGRFFLRNWRLAWIAFRLARRAVHPLALTYFSAVPYRLGSQTIKYRAVPRGAPLAPPRSRCPEDHLYEALQHHLARAPFSFDLEVQRYADDETTPIEDPTRVWKTPFARVARLEIPRQNLSHGGRLELAEHLSFDPWNSLREHEPLGGINRVRRAVYPAVSAHRHALNRVPREEPTPASVLAHRTAADLLDDTVHANVRQRELAVVATVRRGREDDLARLLARIDAELDKGADFAGDPLGPWTLPLFRARSVHFARLVLVEPAAEDAPRHLVLSTNFDGDPGAHRAELVEACGEGLAALFAHCEGFSGDVGAMLARGTKAAAFYVGAPGRSVARIRAEDTLRCQLEAFLDGRDWRHVPALEIRERLREHVFERVDKQWLHRPPPLPRMWWTRLLAGLGVGLGAVALGPAVVLGPLWLAVPLGVAAAAGAVYLKLGRADREDAAAWRRSTPRRGLHEGPAPVQNWLTHCVAVRPGRFRRNVLRGVLAIIDLLARSKFNQGHLGGITTIHFARWLFLPDGRLLFFSNYGGTWAAYLDAFIDEAALGLTAVWSNTEGFPPARPLFRAGAEDGPRFKEWTRAHQQDTDVWYSAYPSLTVKNINQNSRIRLGLYGEMTEAEVRDWLALFGRAP